MLNGRTSELTALKVPLKRRGLLKEFIDQKTLEAAIPGEFKRQGQRLTHYERIGGLTNRNFKLQLGDEQLVLRLPGRGTGRFINRAHERANQYEAAKAGVSPEVLYFNRVTGVKVSSFLHGALTYTPSLARESSEYLRIARFLRRFHDSPIRFRNDFNGFLMVKTYELIARTKFARFYQGYADVRDRVLRLEPLLDAFGVQPRACHNDLVPENILEVEGRLQLIDWEYSGMNDPAWDLASFTLESELDEASALEFLTEYCGDEAPGDLACRVRSFQILQDFLWSIWSLLQAASSKAEEKKGYYLRYGKERFDRAKAMIGAFEADFDLRAGRRKQA